ncbi:hypothetical protein [Methylovorus mays]|uniref:hypothetical protein n=1 Tax=Methylovorus mays TaxID=184077 RepID=UPI001E65740C|nr:hypothetical protein [Methylovorus mays]MCB5206345.1 hypothetical protein [Methylovorus mays]
MKITKSVFHGIFDQRICFQATLGTLAACSSAIMECLIIRVLNGMLFACRSAGIADFSAHMARHEEIGRLARHEFDRHETAFGTIPTQGRHVRHPRRIHLYTFRHAKLTPTRAVKAILSTGLDVHVQGIIWTGCGFTKNGT